MPPFSKGEGFYYEKEKTLVVFIQYGGSWGEKIKRSWQIRCQLDAAYHQI